MYTIQLLVSNSFSVDYTGLKYPEAAPTRSASRYERILDGHFKMLSSVELCNSIEL